MPDPPSDDYSFLRTGFDAVARPATADDLPPEVRDVFLSLMELFLADAIRCAARYAELRRHRRIDGERMRCAMRHVAMEFFDAPDLEERALVVMRERAARGGDDDDDDDDDDDASSTASASSSSSSSTSTAPTASDDDDGFCARVDASQQRWLTWEPDDEVKRLVKRAIDRTPVEA
jgi:hypothetical protein